jgi:hypothetical protein
VIIFQLHIATRCRTCSQLKCGGCIVEGQLASGLRAGDLWVEKDQLLDE